MVINGFEITVREVGTVNCYYVAKRGDKVFRSRECSYVIRKAQSSPPLVWITPIKSAP